MVTEKATLIRRKIAGKFRKGFWAVGAFVVPDENRLYYQVLNGDWYYIQV